MSRDKSLYMVCNGAWSRYVRYSNLHTTQGFSIVSMWARDTNTCKRYLGGGDEKCIFFVKKRMELNYSIDEDYVDASREILAEILSEEYREGHEDEEDDGEHEEESGDQFISDDDVDSGIENHHPHSGPRRPTFGNLGVDMGSTHKNSE